AQNLRLEFGAMTPAHDLLGVFHGVHLNSLVDTILAAYTAEFKKGVAGRLLCSEFGLQIRVRFARKIFMTF
ncbi:hypothetical protein, partial [Polaromonas sp. AET17H-212]|uniref:hypothetical protein n=1 Tax=Polaromonas sp. AET17H-212 TaxID=1977061 RepID=UPI001596AEEA